MHSIDVDYMRKIYAEQAVLRAKHEKHQKQIEERERELRKPIDRQTLQQSVLFLELTALTPAEKRSRLLKFCDEFNAGFDQVTSRKQIATALLADAQAGCAVEIVETFIRLVHANDVSLASCFQAAQYDLSRLEELRIKGKLLYSVFYNFGIWSTVRSAEMVAVINATKISLTHNGLPGLLATLRRNTDPKVIMPILHMIHKAGQCESTFQQFGPEILFRCYSDGLNQENKAVLKHLINHGADPSSKAGTVIWRDTPVVSLQEKLEPNTANPIHKELADYCKLHKTLHEVGRTLNKKLPYEIFQKIFKLADIDGFNEDDSIGHLYFQKDMQRKTKPCT